MLKSQVKSLYLAGPSHIFSWSIKTMEPLRNQTKPLLYKMDRKTIRYSRLFPFMRNLLSRLKHTWPFLEVAGSSENDFDAKCSKRIVT